MLGHASTTERMDGPNNRPVRDTVAPDQETDHIHQLRVRPACRHFQDAPIEAEHSGTDSPETSHPVAGRCHSRYLADSGCHFDGPGRKYLRNACRSRDRMYVHQHHHYHCHRAGAWNPPTRLPPPTRKKVPCRKQVRVGSAWLGRVRVGLDWIAWVRVGSAWLGRVRVMPTQADPDHGHSLARRLPYTLILTCRPVNVDRARRERSGMLAGRGRGAAGCVGETSSG